MSTDPNKDQGFALLSFGKGSLYADHIGYTGEIVLLNLLVEYAPCKLEKVVGFETEAPICDIVTEGQEPEWLGYFISDEVTAEEFARFLGWVQQTSEAGLEIIIDCHLARDETQEDLKAHPLWSVIAPYMANE